MNQIILKQFEGKQVRAVVDENGNPWFVASDTMNLLGIKSQRHALRKLDDDDRGEAEIPGDGGFRKFTTVSESGLYALVLRSTKEEAIRFQKWVTKDVLPSIRKTGQYSTEPQKEMSPLDILENHVRQMRYLEQANANLSTQIQNVAIVARQDHDTLTHDQITELTHLIGSLKDISGDPKDCGRAMKILKVRFNLNGMNTWKEMPRHGFDEAKGLINNLKAGLRSSQIGML